MVKPRELMTTAIDRSGAVLSSVHPRIQMPTRLLLTYFAIAWMTTAVVASAQSDSTGHPLRVRVLGVYDNQSGSPVAAVEVLDLKTGIISQTTSTGTVGLILAVRDTTGTLVTIRKVGYQPVTLSVRTGARDTVPITVTMERVGVVLPVVIAAAGRSIRLGPDDTIPALVRNGFYERRIAGAAPASAFITAEKFRGTMLVSNAKYFGRAICENNVYVDGIKMNPDRRGGRFLRDGIDALIGVDEIAGIETYRIGEMPAAVSHTNEGPLAFDIDATRKALSSKGTGFADCVTLIWRNR